MTCRRYPRRWTTRAYGSGSSHVPLAREPLFDAVGHALDAAALDEIFTNANLQAILSEHQRAMGWPCSALHCGRFQARSASSPAGAIPIWTGSRKARFPATPVVIAHVSRDGHWWFVLTPTYAAWVPKSSIAEGPRSQVLGYVDQRPARLVTGATVRTTMTPENPRVSDLQLDMGIRLPSGPGHRPRQSTDSIRRVLDGVDCRSATIVARCSWRPLIPRTADTGPTTCR